LLGPSSVPQDDARMIAGFERPDGGRIVIREPE
jgi:ABC-type sulfate/molybdate transport systems ATPase subunit